MQRMEHSIPASNRLTNFPCTSPRQYTQKFKSWHLHKYARRKAERKPRRTASIYRTMTGVIREQRSLESVTKVVTRDAARTSSNNEKSDHQLADIQSQLDWMFEDPFLPNETPGMNGARKNSITADRPAEAMQPEGATASSAIIIEDDSEGSENITASLPRNGRPFRATSFPTTLLDRTSNNRPPPNSLHGRIFTSSGLTELNSSYFEYPRDMTEALENESGKKRRGSLILAIWKLWHSGDFSQFEPLLAVAEYCHLLRIDIPERFYVDLDLSEGTASHPRPCRSPDLQPEGQVPSLFNPDGPLLSMRVFAEHGCVIASQKKRMTPAQCQAYVTQAAGRLVSNHATSSRWKPSPAPKFLLNLGRT
jgi:hypothetical protein